MVKSKYPILDSGFGALNPAQSDQGSKTYDLEESEFLAVARNVVLSRMSANSTQGLGQMIGIILRVEGNTNSNGSVDPTDWSELTSIGTSPADKPSLLQVRVRVPELHSCLPIPYDLPHKSEASVDHDIINMYPVFTSRSPDVIHSTPYPGALCWVDFQNKETMTGGILLEIIDSTRYIPPATRTSGRGAHGRTDGDDESSSDTSETAPEETPVTEPSEPEEISEPTGKCPIDTSVGKFQQVLSSGSPSNKRALGDLSKIQNGTKASSAKGDAFKIPSGKMVAGKNINFITAAAQEEIDFWHAGKVAVGPPSIQRGIPSLRSIKEVNDRISMYWIINNAGGNKYNKYGKGEKRLQEHLAGTKLHKLSLLKSSKGGPSKHNYDTVIAGNGRTPAHWSAVTIHYILYRAWKMSQAIGQDTPVGDILDIGINFASHVRYFNGVRKNSNDWKVFALPDFCDVIQVNVGDILIIPRGGGGKSGTIGHGDIVYKIDGQRAYLTGGNPTVSSEAGGGAGQIMLDSNGCIRSMGMGQAYGKGGFYRAESQYTLILKYKPELVDLPTSGTPVAAGP